VVKPRNRNVYSCFCQIPGSADDELEESSARDTLPIETPKSRAERPIASLQNEFIELFIMSECRRNLKR
jgi:hypothetical protein